MGVYADLSIRVKGSLDGSNDLVSPKATFDINTLLQLVSGTGSGQADLMFSDTRTIAASSSENLDLAGGLTDPNGNTLTFVKVKAIYIKAASANTNDVQVGGAASNAFTGPFADATDKISLKAGQAMLITNVATGWTVTASTGDILKVANSSSGSGVDYDIIIFGTSA